ncbi:alpha/beta fold hydrolase [Aquariibacter albus]|uniref:Alpha/beta fold hydrolase n=1 Tax=Aquariibacter albus TaxID=2759899 RepID=A0A839HR94_9BURK|nr:alpha/beta fold hydrolase [Aquariibacter albus]MBB1161571.1 alpha/beta fold hydrolase [Aquariibacter albus]
MQVPTARLRLEVEQGGPVDGAPLLMIMGLGMQLIDWPEGLVGMLQDRGFRTLRFDNRDAGLSERFDALGTPNLAWQGLKHWLHLPVHAPYTLDALADDSLALLDALGLARAHVLGISMGGMVAQLMAARAPQRVRSLALMMSSSGARELPGPRPVAREAMLSRPASSLEDALVEHQVRVFTALGSPGFPPEPQALRERCRRAVRRAREGGPGAAAGYVRQLTAVAASADRSPLLPGLRMPTLVIHGQDDPLLPPACGEQLARLIPGARLDRIPGLGHDLPPALWPRFADAIAANALRDPA